LKNIDYKIPKAMGCRLYAQRNFEDVNFHNLNKVNKQRTMHQNGKLAIVECKIFRDNRKIDTNLSC